MPESDPQISEIESPDGERSLGVKLPILPTSSEALVIGPDTSDDSRKLLQELIEHWGKLGPRIFKKLKKEMKGYGVDQEIVADSFIGFVDAADPDAYLGGEYTLFLRLEFDEPPLWDCFINRSKLVHFQPVF